MGKVGTGWIEVDADLDPFWRRINREVGQLDGRFKSVGASAGKSFGDGFAGGRVAREIDGVRSSLSGLDRDSRRSTKGFQGLAAAMGGGGGGITRAARGLDAFGGASAGATATIGGLRVALAALIPLTVGFGGAAVSVVSALGPLAGLAAAAGNGLAAAAQGFTVFKLATMGVGDALKEQTASHLSAGAGATKGAGQQRAAARAIQSAQDGVRSAVDALSDAQREQGKALDALGPAYTAARVRLRDLRDAVTDSNIALTGAQWAAKDAHKALSELLAGPSPRALADAHRSVADAMRGEDDAVRALTSAHQALNELLKPADPLDLADASDAVTDAMRGEERARLALNKAIASTNLVLADPAATEDEKAQARLELADAENAVGDAARETERARGRLSKLEAGPDQDQIADARRRVADAELGVQDAARQTAEARADVAELETPADAEQIARARDEIAAAENDVAAATRDRTRAVRELAQAEAKGIERSAEVLDAREAIRQANDAVADAELDVQRATQALSDAQLSANESMATGAAAAANLNDKMDSLPPAAQAFVRELIAMKPKLEELRNTAAGGFFPGATEGLHAAMGSFDSVNTVVAQTAAVLGDAARKSGELVGSAAFGKDIETIGGRNAKVIGTLAEALRHVISALRHVMVAAGPLTQWLADVANKWALNAAEAAKAGRETGKLAAFFEKTRAVSERLGSILSHLAGGLLGIGKAGSQSGNQILASIDKAAARFDEWANSVRGRKELRDFFQQTRELAAALVPVLGGMTSAVAGLVLKTLPLTTALGLLGPYADEATTAFIAYKLAAIGVSIASSAAGAAATVAAFATGGWVGAAWSLNAALAANPIGLVVAALVAVGGALYLAYTQSETFRDIVNGAFEAVKNIVGTVIPFIVATITGGWTAVSSATSAAWGAISGVLGAVWEAIRATVSLYVAAWVTVITGAWEAVRVATSTVWALITGALTAAWGAIRAAAGAIWDGIREGILSPMRSARELLEGVAVGIATRLQSAWTAIVAAAGSAWATVRDAILTPIREARELIEGVVGGIANRIQNGWDQITKGAGTFASEIKDKITGAFEGAARAVVGFMNGIRSAINVVLKVVGVDEIPEIKIAGLAIGGTISTRGASNDVQGLYEGGKVTKPMAIVGEEAPKHPEYVIPTNPAYRGRAVALTQSLMSELGMAGVPGYSIGGVISGAWDLLKDGAGAIMPNLPGVGRLPDWLKDTGKWVLEKVGTYVKDAIGGLFGGDGKGGLGAMMKTAVDISSKGYEYSYGGGHNGSFAPSADIRGNGQFGYDCSGFVSAILHAGKLISSPMSTDPLKVYGEGGDGEHVTIGVRGSTGLNAHTMMQLAGKFFESGSGHGAQEVNGWSGSFDIRRHPPGLAMGGLIQEAIAKALDPGEVGWGLARGGVLAPYGGSFATGGVVEGPIGAPRLIEAHGGEGILPLGMQLHADIYIGGEKLDERVEAHLTTRDRQAAGAWHAGLIA